MYMYLIFSLPTELNDDILIELNNYELAVRLERFWVASQLFSYSLQSFLPDTLIKIIPYMHDMPDKKNVIFKMASIIGLGYESVIKLLLSDPQRTTIIQYVMHLDVDMTR